MGGPIFWLVVRLYLTPHAKHGLLVMGLCIRVDIHVDPGGLYGHVTTLRFGPAIGWAKVKYKIRLQNFTIGKLE